MTATQIHRTGQPSIKFVGELLARKDGDYYGLEIHATDDGGYGAYISYNSDGISDGSELEWASLFRNAHAARQWFNEHVPEDYSDDCDEYRDLAAALILAWGEVDPNQAAPRSRKKVKA